MDVFGNGAGGLGVPNVPKKEISKEAAVEFSIMLALIAASGYAKTDMPKYRDTIIKSFTEMLEGLGYVVVKKEI